MKLETKDGWVFLWGLLIGVVWILIYQTNIYLYYYVYIPLVCFSFIAITKKISDFEKEDETN